MSMRTLATAVAFILSGCAAHLETIHGEQPDRTRLDNQEDRPKGAIKSWSSGETLRSADLNSNFSHIHNLMVGGHGARLVDADVNAAAAIAHTKLATPALVPKAWGLLTTFCGVGVCTETLTAGTGIASVQHTAVGRWTITWSTARLNTGYIVQPMQHVAYNYTCYLNTWTTTTASLRCDDNAGAAFDAVWSLVMMDDT